MRLNFQNQTSSLYEVTLNRCQEPPQVAVVTTVAPVREDRSLYLSTGNCLYALNAADGTARWCQQVKLVSLREASYPPMMSVPPPPRVGFATPRVANGVVYVCIDGFGEYNYTCAFNADDGSLLWHTPTDGKVTAMPFMDWAIPLVKNGVVYSGTFALNAQDGTVLWRIAIDTSSSEGTMSLHAVVDETLYATTHWGIYAINAQDGQIRWLYQPMIQSHISGPPVVAGHLLYAGTGGSVGHPEKDGIFALDAATGAEVWRYSHRMGRYVGAVAHHETTIYVSSRDRSLYALEMKSGSLRWRRQFTSPGLSSAATAGDVLYINIGADGAYALRSGDGAVLWRQPLGNSPGVLFSFTPSVVLDGAVYLVRNDKRGKCVLYALDTRTGAECWRWHTSPPSAIVPLSAAQ
ncbi:MAG TPA: PQQ-binding-like beta-propeller repeat protein [Ktedonobacterales bacterium]|jgi:outer membrane protein assembly factor BamB|nr:PQQ-binding-like beta-propeller repeat protein [Ktedonobacterales bacterium]